MTLRQRITNWSGPLLTTRGVLCFWILSGFAYVPMLWILSPGRTLQDAEEAELMQRHLAGGYQLRDPPLYEWMLWTVQQIVGSGPLSYLILRYALIAAIGVLFFFAVSRTVANLRLAAAFSFSLVLFFWFGWEAHHSLAHSLVLLATTLALWIVGLAYAERSTAFRALGLGLIIGAGVLSKWTFALVVACFALALARLPTTRRLYRDPRSLLIPVSATLPVLPFIAWLFSFKTDLLLARSLPTMRGVPLAQTLEGAIVFLTGIPLIFLPWILIVLALGLRFRETKPSKLSHGDAIKLAVTTSVLLITMMALIFSVLTLSGIALFGVARPFAIRYLFPFCLIAALAIAGIAANRVNTDPFARSLCAISIGISFVIFAVKLASFLIVPSSSPATNLLPFARLANFLEQRGLGRAQFITLSRLEAGNLNIYLPNARALALTARIEPPPPDPIADRPCALLWGGENLVSPSAPPSSKNAEKFLKLLGISGGQEQAERVVINWDKTLIGAPRRSVWYMLQGNSVDRVCQKLKITGLLCARSCPKAQEGGEAE